MQILSRICGALTMLIGAGVLCGWSNDIGWLTHFSFFQASTQPVAAFLMLVSGFMLLFLPNNRDNRTSLAVSFCSQSILFLISGLVASRVLNWHFEDLFYKSAQTGFPSVGAFLGFMLVAFSGLCYVFNGSKRFARMRKMSIAIFAIGAVAIAGVILDCPFLSFHIPEKSIPLAVPTAIGFMIFAIGLRASIPDNKELPCKQLKNPLIT